MILYLLTTPMSNIHNQNLICGKLQDFASIHQVQTKFERRKQSSNELLKKRKAN